MQALSDSGAALTTLDLGAIGELGRAGGILIRDYLCDSSTRDTLQHLLLDTNELGDTGVAAVAAGAAACSRLQTLNLEANEITKLGALALAYNPIATLQRLLLEDNLDLPAAVARQLQAIYPKVTVDEDLRNDDDDSDVVEEEEDHDVDALADAMKTAHMEERKTIHHIHRALREC